MAPTMAQVAVAATCAVALSTLAVMMFNSTGGATDGGGLRKMRVKNPYEAPRVLWEVLPKEPRKPHVVITGGGGFIGSQLGYYLHTQGHEVTLIDNMHFGYGDNLEVDGKRFGRFVLGDVLDPHMRKYYEGADTVFHFAALSALPVCQADPVLAMKVNVGGVAEALDAARIHGVRRFVFASTSAVYENNREMPFREDDPVSPHLIYSLSKYHGEQLCKAMSATYGLEVTILRFFNVFGPHQDFRRKSPPFTSYIVRELVNNRRPILHSDGYQRRDYVFLSDLMNLAVLAMTHPKARGETFNVASNTTFSVREMFAIVQKELGSTVEAVFQPAERFWDHYPELFTGKLKLDKAILVKEVEKRTLGSRQKAKDLLGWEPVVTMEQGLQQMVRFVRTKQDETSKMLGGWGQHTAPPS